MANPALLAAVVMLGLLGTGLPFVAVAGNASFSTRVGLSTGLGLAGAIGWSLAISVLRLPGWTAWLVFAPALLVLAPAWRARMTRDFPRPEARDLLLLVASLAVATRTLAPRFGYLSPLHLDELYVVRGGAVLARGEGLATLLAEPHHAAIETLYSLVLRLGGGDPITSIAILPGCIAGAIAWTTGALVGRLLRSPAAEAPAALLWLGLRSDGFLLGLELFVGSTLAILFTLTALLAMTLDRPARQRALIAAPLVFGRGLIHPTTAILSVPAICLGLRPSATGLWRWSPYVAAGTALGSVLLVSAAGPAEGGFVVDWVRRLRFGLGLPAPCSSAVLLLALPVTWLGLAAGGAIHLWRRRHTTPLADLMLMLALAGMVGAVSGVSWSARAERLLYHAQALSVPLAGVGMWLSLSIVRRAGVRSWTSGWAVLGLALLAFGALLPGTGASRPRYWRYFEPGLRGRLDQITQDTPVDARVLALPSDAIVLQALGRHAYPTAPRFNDPQSGDLPWVLRFFSPGQDSLRRAVLLETRTDFVFSRVPLALRGLDLVHPSDASRMPPYLYRVDRHALGDPRAQDREVGRTVHPGDSTGTVP